MRHEKPEDVDAALADQARLGDAAAFVRFAEHWWTPVYRFSWIMSGSVSFAADATERTLLAAMRSTEPLRSSRAAVKIFLYRVALHFALMRSAGLRPVIPADATAALREALLRLEPLDRARVALFEIEQLPVEEIASVMSTPVDETRARVSLALVALTDSVTSTLHSIALRATG